MDDINSVLHLSEVLIIDCPVKIAPHQSCKEDVKRRIEKMGFAVCLSSSYGRCFGHQKSTNKPSFGVVIDAIVNSCHVSSINKHVIHIGNVGMRHAVGTAPPVQAGNGVCQLQKMFKLIQHVRRHRIQVETTQLDIAFNLQSHDLIQWSAKKKKQTQSFPKHKSRPSIVLNISPEVWPIHSLVCLEGGGLASESQQKGTLRVKNVQPGTLK